MSSLPLERITPDIALIARESMVLSLGIATTESNVLLSVSIFSSASLRRLFSSKSKGSKTIPIVNAPIFFVSLAMFRAVSISSFLPISAIIKTMSALSNSKESFS